MTGGPVGLVLAAGAGSRFGMPKALARTGDGVPWLHRATTVLTEGGCAEVVVVLGALAEGALHLAPVGTRVVLARDWGTGQAASLRAGLAECARTDAVAAVVTLVDLPGLQAVAVRRVAASAGPEDLRRATYDGVPGHPVLLGRSHWAAVSDVLAGDIGARHFLAGHGATAVDCTGLGGDADVDNPGAA